MAGATILFLLISISSLRRRLECARGDWKTFAGIAITGLVLNQAFFMTGLNFSSVTHASLTFAMVPIFVLVISRWTHMEALTGAKILGVLVAFGGVTVLTLPGTPLDGSYRVGNLILLAGAVVFSIYMILAKRAAVRYDGLTLNVVSYPMGSLLLAPVMAGNAPRIRLGRCFHLRLAGWGLRPGFRGYDPLCAFLQGPGLPHGSSCGRFRVSSTPSCRRIRNLVAPGANYPSVGVGRNNDSRRGLSCGKGVRGLLPATRATPAWAFSCGGAARWRAGSP